MNSVNLNSSLNYANNAVFQAHDSSPKLPEQKASAMPTKDSFEHKEEKPAIGYENFSIYRKVVSSLDKLRSLDLPPDGIPSPALLKATLESIEREIVEGKEPISNNPYVITDLLDSIIRKHQLDS